VISCGGYCLTAGKHGIEDLRIEGLGRIVSTKRFMLGELVLEMDVGNPWYSTSLDRRRHRLSSHGILEGIEQQGDSYHVCYQGMYHDPATSPEGDLCWRQYFRLYCGVPWLHVETRSIGVPIAGGCESLFLPRHG